ncbi:hypothetical protein [Niabella hibiscisoli]|uniref:hypothetical protein n=1 Tax=Niabella hibiscisoli TaxID=1825928 RepID=UPI001F107EC7|nr:hypothetical protein [Niabella hibiscisoli]MCH5720519.1 hypothetical protein [Niabella hibiscisoli]
MRKTIFLLFVLLSTSVLHSQSQSYKGKTGFAISLPLVYNTQYFDYSHFRNRKVNRTRIIGIGASLYRSLGKDAVSFGASYQFNIDPELAQAKGYQSSRQHVENLAFDFLYNKSIHRNIKLLGGIGLSRYRYILKDIWLKPTDLGKDSSYKKNDFVVGPNLGVQFRINNFLSTSLIYRPGIISLNSKHYFHNISLSFDIHPLHIKGSVPKRERPVPKFRR